MPLKGIICDVDNSRVEKTACLACRMSRTPREGLTHHCSWPFEMLKGMMNTSGRARASISTTQLSSCPRQIRLLAENDYYITAKTSFPSWRGTLGHFATEAEPEPGVIYEKRFEVRIPGIKPLFTGQIDCLDIQKRRIKDFKTRKDSGMPDEPKPEHIMQLNCYRLLARFGWPQDAFEYTLPNGDEWEFPVGIAAAVEVDDLMLVYWSMSEVRTFSTERGNMVPILSDDEVWSYIKTRAAVLAAPELPDIPENWGPDSGNPICRNWCPVKSLCEQKMMNDLNNGGFGF